MTAGGAYYRTVRQRWHQLGSHHGYGWDAADGDRATRIRQPVRGSLTSGGTGSSRPMPAPHGPPVRFPSPFRRCRIAARVSLQESLFVGTMSGSHRKRGEEEWRCLGIAGPVWDMMYRSGPLFIAGNRTSRDIPPGVQWQHPRRRHIRDALGERMVVREGCAPATTRTGTTTTACTPFQTMSLLPVGGTSMVRTSESRVGLDLSDHQRKTLRGDRCRQRGQSLGGKRLSNRSVSIPRIRGRVVGSLPARD